MTKRLFWSLCSLASVPEIQLELYPEFVSASDELALDFDDAIRMEPRTYLSEEQTRILSFIDDALTTMQPLEGVWTSDGLKNAKEWKRIRELSIEALECFGVVYAVPGKSDAKFVKGGGA